MSEHKIQYAICDAVFVIPNPRSGIFVPIYSHTYLFIPVIIFSQVLNL